MALQSSNKLRVYAENGGAQSPTTVMSDSDFDGSTERQTGSKPNTPIDSMLTNTVLKETSTVTTALIDALKQISGDTTEVGAATAVDALATLIKQMLMPVELVSQQSEWTRLQYSTFEVELPHGSLTEDDTIEVDLTIQGFTTQPPSTTRGPVRFLFKIRSGQIVTAQCGGNGYLTPSGQSQAKTCTLHYELDGNFGVGSSSTKAYFNLHAVLLRWSDFGEIQGFAISPADYMYRVNSIKKLRY